MNSMKPTGPQCPALHIVFDAPPGPKGCRFIEVETPDRRSVRAGEWHERDDGYWELRINRTVDQALLDALETAQDIAKSAWVLMDEFGISAPMELRMLADGSLPALAAARGQSK